MKRLIVDTNNAPMRKVFAILTTWARLAELVDDQVTLARGCELEWELIFQHVSRATGFSVKKDVDYWEAFSAVKMVFPARVEGISAGLEKQTASVPLTEVEGVVIQDNGTFYWHSDRAKPEDNIEAIKRLGEAVSKGKLLCESGMHHYRKNWIPSLGE